MSKSSKKKDSCVIPFHFLLAKQMASNVGAIQVSPSGLGLRAATEADGWASFRVRSMRFRIHPGVAGDGPFSVGYLGSIADTAPSTIAGLMELQPSIYQANLTTTPSGWMNVGKEDLAGPFPWYKSINGAADTTEEAPGSLYFVTGAATTNAIVNLEVYITLEFKTSVTTGSTPMQIMLLKRIRQERLDHARAVERETLLKILQAPTAGAAPAAASAPTGFRSDLIRPPTTGSEW